MYTAVIILYQIILLIISIVLIFPVFVLMMFSHKFRNELADRFHLKKINNKNEKYIWVHCLSLGEVQSAKKFIEQILKNDFKVYATTNTKTGYKALIQHFNNRIEFSYTPVDIFFVINRVIKDIQPQALIIIEWDIWPVMIGMCKRKDIPVFMVNGRLGKAGEDYSRFKFIFKKVFSAFDVIITQSEGASTIFRDLCPNTKIITGNNIKYDSNIGIPRTIKELGIKCEIDDAPVICAGSTHSPEELPIIKAFYNIYKKYNAKLIIAPRNINECKNIIECLKTYNLDYDLRSSNIWNKPVLIVDTTGELMSFYSVSDIVIMGGSFSESVQGHNIIEPASLGKVIICGEYMDNFKEIFNIFKKNNAIIISSENSIEFNILYVLENNGIYKEISTNALNIVKKYNGESALQWDIVYKSLIEKG